MPKYKVEINDENIYEWLCSVGYLLPSNERELERFEKLHPLNEIKINETSIDPLAIVNGTRIRKTLSISIVEGAGEEQQELRMAARKQQGLPQDILDLIKKNQEDQENNTKNEQSGESENT